MTATVTGPDTATGDQELASWSHGPSVAAEPLPPERRRLTRGRVVGLVVMWFAVFLACIGLVLYLLEPLLQNQTQEQLFDQYTGEIDQAYNEAQSPLGIEVDTKAPEFGAPVGILEIPNLQLQQVVVEGAGSAQTQDGPGHVAGTAGLGQPGNSAVVGRRATFGGPFADLEVLQPGDKVLSTTTQGQIVYVVETVEEKEVTLPRSDTAAEAVASAATGNLEASAEGEASARITTDELYGPTEDDRLTLVTSASALPWNAESATVVVAKMESEAFEPTAQNGRTDSGAGLSGDDGARAPLLLSIMGFVASALAAVWLYRRSSARVAYLMTTPPLVVFMILIAQYGSQLMPAWW